MKSDNKVKRPRVGLAGIILKDRKVLLGLRKGSYEEGTWSFSRGHLEMFEDFKDCLRMEIKEEIDLRKGNVEFLSHYPCAVTNDFFEESGKHYVILYFRLQYLSVEVKNLEPDKCEKWGWYDWNNLAKPLFVLVINLKKMVTLLFIRNN